MTNSEKILADAFAKFKMESDLMEYFDRSIALITTPELYAPIMESVEAVFQAGFAAGVANLGEHIIKRLDEGKAS